MESLQEASEVIFAYSSNLRTRRWERCRDAASWYSKYVNSKRAFVCEVKSNVNFQSFSDRGVYGL